MQALRRLVEWLLGEGWGALALVLITLAFGISLYSAAPLVPWGQPNLANTVRQVSTTLMAVVIVQVLTRAYLWKNAIDTFYARLSIREAISDTGLRNFWWFPEVPWRDLFEGCQEIQVVAISANTLFTDANVGLVKEFLQRRNTTIEAVLADPGDADLMASYDRQFSQPEGHRRDRVRSSIRELLAIAEEQGAANRVTVRLSSTLPRYSSYRFGDKYLFVPYLVVARRSPERIPVLCFGPGPFVEKYLGHDLSYVIGNAKKLILEEPGEPATKT